MPVIAGYYVPVEKRKRVGSLGRKATGKQRKEWLEDSKALRSALYGLSQKKIRPKKSDSDIYSDFVAEEEKPRARGYSINRMLPTERRYASDKLESIAKKILTKAMESSVLPPEVKKEVKKNLLDEFRSLVSNIPVKGKQKAMEGKREKFLARLKDMSEKDLQKAMIQWGKRNKRLSAVKKLF